MKADVTFSQLYWNSSLMNFFFRDQSSRTVEEMMASAQNKTEALDRIDGYANDNDLSLDDIEEMFYEDSVEELAKEFDIKLEEEENE